MDTPNSLTTVTPSVQEDRTAWAARFGWMVGGLLGTVAGFVTTFILETRVLRGHVSDPSAAATRASSVLVAVLFLSGALPGHAFGARGGPSRYRLLGIAAGLSIAIILWAVIVLTR